MLVSLVALIRCCALPSHF